LWFYWLHFYSGAWHSSRLLQPPLSLSLSLGKCSLGFCREIEGGSDKGLFGIVVVLAVQSAFRLKIYQNKVFFIKKLFLILAHQNDLKT
jgi:hypothetical protein